MPPDISAMLAASDAALLIGDPALAISSGVAGGGQNYRVFDLVELWKCTRAWALFLRCG